MVVSLSKFIIMKKYRLIFLLMIATLLFSCSKDKSKDEPKPQEDTFMPSAARSYWHYKDTTNNTGFKLIATDKTETKDGIRFHVYDNVPDSSPTDTSQTLIGTKDNDYYISALLPELGDDKFIFLKKDAEVGDSWSQRIQLPMDNGTQEFTFTFKIKEKGITHKVLTHTFNKVIRIRISINVLFQNSPVGDLYFEPGVGILQVSMDLLDQLPPVHLLLTDYDIR